MFGIHFYHERIRKSVATFGSIFNQIYVIRKGSSGDVISTVKVPLSYAPKQKFLERLRETPDLDNDQKVAIKLPRMSFEIISVQYDPQRSLPKVNSFNKGSTSVGIRNKFKSSVPYTLGIQLSIYAKSQDDALQIVEQIIPYFAPQYTLTIRPFAEYPDIKEDVPVTLQGITMNDDYEGSVESRRTIIYTLDYEMKINFYGPTESAKIIRQVDVDTFMMGQSVLDSDQYTGTIRLTPDPIDVSADSDYGFNSDLIYNTEYGIVQDSA
jgi:hypothetical protein